MQLSFHGGKTNGCASVGCASVGGASAGEREGEASLVVD